MEFDGPSFYAWELLRERSATLSMEKLFAAAARHVLRQSTTPTVGEIARLSKWPAGSSHTTLTHSDVMSLWSFACLVSLECTMEAGGDAEKLAKRLRRALQRSSQGSVTSEDEALISVIASAVATSAGAPSVGVIVNDIVVETTQALSRIVLGIAGQSTFAVSELPQAAEVIVA